MNMKWVDIRKELPTVHEYDEDGNCPDLCYLFKGEKGLFMGTFRKTKPIRQCRLEEGNGFNVQLIEETIPAREYIAPSCRFGEYCTEEEIPLNKITHWALIEQPEE